VSVKGGHWRYVADSGPSSKRSHGSSQFGVGIAPSRGNDGTGYYIWSGCYEHVRSDAKNSAIEKKSHRLGKSIGRRGN
jgi:hypothetical protein